MLVNSLAVSSGRSVQGATKVDSPHETEDPKDEVQRGGDDEPNEVQHVSNESVGVVRSSDITSKVHDSDNEGGNREGELNREEHHEDNHDHVVASLDVEEGLRSSSANKTENRDQ